MDKDFFVRQIEARGGMLFRVAYALLHSEEDCKDALQEAALKAWEKRASLRDEKLFGTWLTRILINECHNIMRKRRPALPLEEAPEPSAPPPDLALALAVRALPESLRLPMVLRYSEGMAYSEIARALRLTQATVRGRIHRAKEQLRKELEA